MSFVPSHLVSESPQETLGAATPRTAEKRCVAVQEGYERWAPTYDHDPNPLLALEERVLCRMLPRLAGKRVLDLACGTGRWLTRLMVWGASSAVGVDFSAAMLAGAKGKPSLRNRLVQGDCRAIPFVPACFDLVIHSFAVGHIRDVANVAREIRRVAAPSADVYVSDLHPLAYEQGWHTGFRDDRGRVEITTWPRSAQEFLALWMTSGFDCVQAVDCRFGEPERRIFARAGKERLLDFFRPTPAVLICHFRRPVH